MKAHQDPTYLTTDELAVKIKYDSRTIRERLKDSVLLEGTHYIRPASATKKRGAHQRPPQQIKGSPR